MFKKSDRLTLESLGQALRQCNEQTKSLDEIVVIYKRVAAIADNQQRLIGFFTEGSEINSWLRAILDGQDKLLQSHVALKADLDVIRDEIKLNHRVLDDALVKYLASFGQRLGAIETSIKAIDLGLCGELIGTGNGQPMYCNLNRGHSGDHGYRMPMVLGSYVESHPPLRLSRLKKRLRRQAI